MNQSVSTNDIWEKAFELGLDKQSNLKGKTPWATLGARLYTDVRDNPNSIFEAVGKNPKRFGLKSITGNVASILPIAVAEPIIKIEKFTERDLHPFLVKFADSFFHFRGAKLKRIFTKTRLNKRRATTNGFIPIWWACIFRLTTNCANTKR